MRMESLMKKMALTQQSSGLGFVVEEHSETYMFKNGIVFIVYSSTCHIFRIGPMVSQHNLWMLEQGWGMDADLSE